MSDDLVKRLRCYADIDSAVYHPWVYGEAADLIEKMEKERDDAKYLLQQYFRLSREASDESDARIEKLEAALLDLCDGYECCPVSRSMRAVARKALEGKDD